MDAPEEAPVSKRTRAGGTAPPGSVFSPTSSVDSQNKKSASSQNTHSVAAQAAVPAADAQEHELSSRAAAAPRDSMSTAQQRCIDLTGAGPAAEFVGASAAGALTNVEYSNLRSMMLASIAEASGRLAPPSDIGRGNDGSWDLRTAAPNEASSLQMQLLQALKRAMPGAADGLTRQFDAPSAPQYVPPEESKPQLERLQDGTPLSALKLLNDLAQEIANITRARTAAEPSAAAPVHDAGRSAHSGVLDEATKLAGGGGGSNSLVAMYSQAIASAKQLGASGGGLSHTLSGDRSALSSYTQYTLPNAPQSPGPPMASQTSADRSLASAYSHVMASRNQSLIQSMLPSLAKASSADHISRSLMENYKHMLDSHQAQFGDAAKLRSVCSDQSALSAVASRLSGHALSSFFKPAADAGAPAHSTAALGLQQLEQTAAHHIAEGHALSSMNQEALRLLRAHSFVEDVRRRAGLDGGRPPHAAASEPEHAALTSAAAAQRAALSAAELLRVSKTLDLSPHALSSLLLKHTQALDLSAVHAPGRGTAPPFAERSLHQSDASRTYFLKLASTIAAVADWVNKTTTWTGSLKLGGELRLRNAVCRMASLIMRRRPPSELRLALTGQAAPTQQAPAQFADAARQEAPTRRAEVSSAVMMLAELVELQQLASKGAWRQSADPDGANAKSCAAPALSVGLDLPVTSLKPARSYINVDRF